MIGVKASALLPSGLVSRSPKTSPVGFIPLGFIPPASPCGESAAPTHGFTRLEVRVRRSSRLREEPTDRREPHAGDERSAEQQRYAKELGQAAPY